MGAGHDFGKTDVIGVAVVAAVAVVQEEDVDAVGAEALQAVLEGAHDAVVAVVDLGAERGGSGEEGVGDGPGGGRAAGGEAPAGFGGEDGAGGQTAQGGADAVLGEAEAVERGGVDVGDAGGDGGLDGGHGGVFGLGLVEVAEAGGAEAEGG